MPSVPPNTCSSGAIPLANQRRALMIVLDDAASLAPWWSVLSEGLLAFLEEDDSAGLGIALLLADDVCEPAMYLPPLVPMAALPGNLGALEQAVPIVAGKNTSTVPALGAGLQYARSWALDHPGDDVSLVLISDISPGSCDALTGNPDEVLRLVREAYSGSPSIKTYVVGGGGLGLIDGVASAGGTGAYPIYPLDTSDDMLTALRTIRGNSDVCAFAWPSGSDPGATGRVLARDGSGMQREIPIVPAASGCNPEGFYLEQSVLKACPRTCAALSAGDQLMLCK